MIKSATPAASAKVGMSRSVWLKVSSMLVGRARLSWAFDLSPMTMIGEEGSTVESLAEESGALLKARRVVLEKKG